MLSARHTARSNVHADARADLQTLAAAIGHDKALIDPPSSPNATDEPLYACELTVQRLAVPVRIAALDARGQPDPRLHTRPNVAGVQTALVVGLQAPVHTDRDHRIKIQFHWQRGGNSSHRLEHPSGSNAPASDASGSWVRVAESVAGANWGMNFTPRLGQEVLVGFIEGDIDRPVVIGSVYNGRGPVDAQGNQAAAGAAGASGNAPAWFPGEKNQGQGQGQSQGQGSLQGHQHAAVHAGFKSQALASSQSGAGGFNQLVLDDSAQAGRIELATSVSAGMASSRLQLGHLLQQSDNQRLQLRGHGIDLMSDAWGAVRAGSGLLLSAHGKPGSSSAGQQLDSSEPKASIEQARQLVHALAESAQKQNAKLEGEPDVIGATDKDTGRQLDVERAHHASLQSLGMSAGSGSTADATIGGGLGTVTAWARPDLVIAAPGGIASFTPAASVYSAGNTLSLVATQDVQHLTQGSHATAVKGGIVLYTYGKITANAKPNQETGIKLHAASGGVSMQSQSAATRLTADKAVEVRSTGGMVRITAPNHILLTAMGAALDIQPASITLKGPGKIEFRASIKELTGGASASLPTLNFARPELEIKKTAAFPVSL